MGHHSNEALAARVADLPRPQKSWPRWVVTGGGVGFLRPAPGSWGTAAPAAGLWIALACGAPDPWRSAVLLAFGTLAAVLVVAYGKWAAAYFRRPDPGPVILDEYAGFAVAAAFVPEPAWCLAHAAAGPFVFVAGLYILFRFTDTLKLPPSNLLERLPWGWGILCDDISAGIQANIIAQLIARFAFGAHF